jgi:hypothetical protein
MTVDMGATISVRSLSPFGERVGVGGALEPWKDFEPLTPPLSLWEREQIEPAGGWSSSVMIPAMVKLLYAEDRDPGVATGSSARNGSMAPNVASGNSSCTASFPRGSRAVRMPGTAASASISARDFGGVSAP